MADMTNIDIVGMIARLDRIYTELAESVSSQQPNGLLDHDRERAEDYVSDFRRYWLYVQGQPIPDSPESHDTVRWPVPEFGGKAPGDIENEDIAQLLRQLVVYRTEMAESQSRVLIQGFIGTADGRPGDRQRFADAIDRIENFIKYAQETQPSDRPESTPKTTSA